MCYITRDFLPLHLCTGPAGILLTQGTKLCQIDHFFVQTTGRNDRLTGLQCERGEAQGSSDALLRQLMRRKVTQSNGGTSPGHATGSGWCRIQRVSPVAITVFMAEP